MRPLRREGVDLAEASTSLVEPRHAGRFEQLTTMWITAHRRVGEATVNVAAGTALKRFCRRFSGGYGLA